MKIAVLDSGVAYRNHGRYKKSPDLKSIRFAKGHDFCAKPGVGVDACSGEDAHPDDDYGHGTHVTSTIVETPNNGVGLTGLAYGATIIPVKVLNAAGDGDEDSIAKGIRYAAKQGAQIINLSFEFSSSITSASQIPAIASAVKLRAAQGRADRRRGRATPRSSASPTPRRCPASSLSAPSPSTAASRATPTPARASTSSAPAAATTRILSRHALPGRSRPPDLPTHAQRRQAHLRLPDRLLRHVDGGPAGLGHGRADHRLRRARPQARPRARSRDRLKATARDLGAPGPDEQYGAGLIDAGAATAP